ncbi:MAG: four helix bundle protein [Bdellovibrionaceae bacterium]|nr:four helix bundle protein [Pseudobdellovibrionaceae bacterium]
MAKVNRFEDLEAYQAAMDLAEAVYTLVRNSPLQKDRSLSEQLRRAAISVPSNIAEGYERNGNREFNKHFF